MRSEESRARGHDQGGGGFAGTLVDLGGGRAACFFSFLFAGLLSWSWYIYTS